MRKVTIGFLVFWGVSAGYAWAGQAEVPEIPGNYVPLVVAGGLGLAFWVRSFLNKK